MKTLLAFLVLLPLVTGQFFASLDEEGRYNLSWTVDKSTDTVEFTVTCATTGWVGFGLNKDAVMMAGSDMVIATTTGGTQSFTDRHAIGESTPIVDAIQNYELLEYTVANGVTTLVFSRLINTCDNSEDVPINVGTMRVLYAWSSANEVGGVLPIHSVRGGKTINILAGPSPPVTLPEDTTQFVIAFDAVNVPSSTTSYWCKSVPMPAGDFHVIANTYIIQPENVGVVHHMLVYACSGPLASPEDAYYEGDCWSEATPWPRCGQDTVIAGWAVGGGPYYFPENVGLPFGNSSGWTSLYMEMHYDNPLGLSNIVDSSGVVLHLTTQKRQYDAGVARLGVDLISILLPPGVDTINMTGVCTTDCTSAHLPVGGINVFSSLLHIHTTGRAIETRHYRNGVQLPNLAADPNYDFNYQELVTLDPMVTILPGDYLETECWFTTTGRPYAVVGGLGTPEEMCMNYIFYYPRVEGWTYCESIHDTFGLDLAGDFSPTGEGLFMWLVQEGLTMNQAGNFMNDALAALPLTDVVFQGIMDNYGVSWTPANTATFLELFNNNREWDLCLADHDYDSLQFGPEITPYAVTTPLPPVYECMGEGSETSSTEEGDDDIEDVVSGSSATTGHALMTMGAVVCAAAVFAN